MSIALFVPSHHPRGIIQITNAREAQFAPLPKDDLSSLPTDPVFKCVQIQSSESHQLVQIISNTIVRNEPANSRQLPKCILYRVSQSLKSKFDKKVDIKNSKTRLL